MTVETREVTAPGVAAPATLDEAPLDGFEAPRRGSAARRWFVRVLMLAALVAGAVAGVRWYRRTHAPTAPPGVTVRYGDVVQKATATGRIVPRQEVFVRPLVSGMLVELRVRPGDVVHRGDELATVRIVADPVALGDARAQAGLAQVRFDRASRELGRARTMASRDLLASQSLAQAEDDERVARAELAAAQARAQLIAQGSSQRGSLRSNRVLAPIDGTVLAVPVSLGDYVSETGTFRDGTVVATLANMSDLIFKGQIEEAYVGQLRLGMSVAVRVGALSGDALHGELQWISPRATIESGTGVVTVTPGTVPTLTASTAGVTRFELWAALTHVSSAVRAGYSAAAEFELARSTHVLLLQESALKFTDGRAYVQPCAGGREREVGVGVSDGVRIEITRGVREGECVREREP